jgi:cellulose synthase/poly-beta-1,6-N-acetylglucosamine synthase-like glycosyltransferase
MAEVIIKVLKIADIILFCYSLSAVAYVLTFAVMSLLRRIVRYPHSEAFKRILVIIPAYREDKVIFDSVNSITKQNYPSDCFKVIVVSDGMRPETDKQLLSAHVEVLTLSFPSGSKANALISAVTLVKGQEYDIAAVLDADNVVPEGFLSDINDAFYSGARAVQAHRRAKNLNTDIAVLDAISEEINNSVFRKGHVNMGLSSALIGSGMAFEFQWFCEHIPLLATAGEDKEMEMMLLKERIHISYIDYSYVYDEKTQKAEVFYKQRRRWIAAQFWSLKTGIKELPSAISSFNIDYIDKIFQWFLLPRILLLGIIGLMSVTVSFVSFQTSVKWWILLIAILGSLLISVPRSLWNAKSLAAVKRLPLIFVMVLINLFRTKGVNSNYIHTQKGI